MSTDIWCILLVGCNLADGNQKNISNSYWNNAQNKKEFCNVFYGNYKNFCSFFQQGNDTHTVLHIIDNIELKLDCKFKIAIAIYVKQKRPRLRM